VKQWHANGAVRRRHRRRKRGGDDASGTVITNALLAGAATKSAHYEVRINMSKRIKLPS